MATIACVESTLSRAIRIGHNIKYIGQPALGKTTEIMRCGDKWMAEKKIDFFSVWNGPGISPIDLSATMPDLENGILKRFHDGSLPNFYKTPDLKGFIFIGEAEGMGGTSQMTLQKIVNHEDFGDHTHPIRVPPGVIFATDGNLSTDRSNTQAQGRAYASRFRTIELHFDTQPALDYALSHFHPKVGSFLKQFPQYIDNYAEVFKPDRSDNDRMRQEGKKGVWASMRTWNYLSDMFNDLDVNNEPLIQEELECVGAGMAARFSEHLLLLDNLASVEDVIKSPKTAPVPKKSDETYAITYMLSLSVKAATFKPISVYMHRMSPEMQTVFLLTMNDRFNDMQKKAPAGVRVTDGAAIRSSQEYIAWSCEDGISKLMLNQLRG